MDQRSTFREKDHETSIPLQGRQVTRCYADTAFGIQFLDKAGEFTLRIDGPFTEILDGEIYCLNPPHRRSLGPALELYGKVISRAVATQAGALLLTFSDDTEIVVQPNDDYEAWTLSGPNGYLLVSTPGAGLAIWDRRR